MHKSLQLPPALAQQYLVSLSRQEVLQRYKWGIRTEADLPSSYGLLKQQKKFLAARPIISYRGFIFADLFKAVAVVLRTLLKEGFPQALGHLSMPEIFQQLHVFLESLPDDVTFFFARARI